MMETIFISASLVAPGNTHNSTYFQSISLWDEINAVKVLTDKNCVVDGAETPPDGDAVLTPEKGYFNYCLSRARMITKGAFGKLKRRFRVLFCKCESKKETVKIVGLACVVLHNLCIDKEDILPRKFDLSYDHATNKCRDRAELRDILNLTNSRLKNYDTRRREGVKFREAISKASWDEKIEIRNYITFRKHFKKTFT